MTNGAALIGYTGFVGSYLYAQGDYTHGYNSKNIASIAGQHFGRIVCSATPATKWLANKEPEQDWQTIQRLMAALQAVTAEKFFLISTVDVFQHPAGVDETTPVLTEGGQAYGTHRYQLEQFVRERFPSATIIRLPAMFGPGLKKNALYDLIHHNEVEKIARDGVFQWYNLRRLPQDLRRAASLPLVHLVTEPLALATIIERYFPAQRGCGRPGGAHYDLKTIHAATLGGANGYLANAATVLDELGAFIAAERTRLAQAG